MTQPCEKCDGQAFDVVYLMNVLPVALCTKCMRAAIRALESLPVWLDYVKVKADEDHLGAQVKAGNVPPLECYTEYAERLHKVRQCLVKVVDEWLADESLRRGSEHGFGARVTEFSPPKRTMAKTMREHRHTCPDCVEIVEQCHLAGLNPEHVGELVEVAQALVESGNPAGNRDVRLSDLSAVLAKVKVKK